MKIDGNRLKKIESAVSHCQMVWQIDSFYVETCVREKDERPFYPITFMCVDQDSDFVLSVNLVSRKRFEDEFIEYFLNLVEEHKLLPKEILVKKEELFVYLKPIADFFNIELKSVKRLYAVEKARRSMFDFFARRE